MKKNFKSKLILAAMGLFSSAAMNGQVIVQAESFLDKEGDKWTEIVVENNVSIGYFDERGEILNYEVEIPTTGMYQFSAKYVAIRDGKIRVVMDDGAFAYYNFEGDLEDGDNWWKRPMGDWFEIPASDGPSFYLTAGKHTFKVVNEMASANIDYFTFVKSDVTDKEIVKIKNNPGKIELVPMDVLRVFPIGYNAAGQKIALPATFSSNVKDGIYTAKSYGKDKISVTMGGYTQDLEVNIAKPTKRKEFVVTKNGYLNTSKGYVANEKGEKTSLAGISYFWINENPVGLFWNKETVDYLVDEYNMQVFRLPITISPCGSNGQEACSKYNDVWGYKEGGSRENYRYNPEWMKEMADRVIKACIENDVYVIIDFHEHKAENWVDLANDFFTYFASKWGEYPNVMYEIYNEPLCDDQTVVNYAKKVIPTIRNIDKKNVIIVGSSEFSRHPDKVTDAGKGYENIAYTWHGYVKYNHQADWGQHSEWNTTVPVVVTEWGCGQGGGDGDLRSIYKNRGVIHCFWSMANKNTDGDEAWSILKANVIKKSGWSSSEINSNGAGQLAAAKSWINYTPKVLVVETPEFETSICAGSKVFLPEDKVTVSGSAKGGSGNYTYKWEQTKGEGATIANPSSAKTEISGLKAGVNVFSLTISDGTDSETMGVTITVYPEGWTDPGLIDDVADNDTKTRIGGFWKVFDDAEQNANPHSTITEADQLPVDQHIKATAKMGNKWGGGNEAYCGVDMYLQEDKSGMDISNCSKVTYKFKGSSHIFRAVMTAVKDEDYHSYNVEGSNDWKEVSVNLASLKQAPDWGTDMAFSKESISKFSWMLRGNENTTRTLEIDDVTCVGMEFSVNVDPTSVENATEISKMYLFPNPSEDGSCTLIVLDRCNVVITNVAGQVVKEFVAVPDFNNDFSINEKGIYFVKAGNEVTKLIVK